MSEVKNINKKPEIAIEEYMNKKIKKRNKSLHIRKMKDTLEIS